MSDRWPIEEIPDADRLYMRVHRQWFKGTASHPASSRTVRTKPPARCRPTGASTPRREETRARARRPELNAVIELVVGEVRAIPEQVVRHAPIQVHPVLPNNRPHTNVAGPKETGDLEIQDTYARSDRLVIPVDAG